MHTSAFINNLAVFDPFLKSYLIINSSIPLICCKFKGNIELHLTRYTIFEYTFNSLDKLKNKKRDGTPDKSGTPSQDAMPDDNAVSARNVIWNEEIEKLQIKDEELVKVSSCHNKNFLFVLNR